MKVAVRVGEPAREVLRAGELDQMYGISYGLAIGSYRTQSSSLHVFDPAQDAASIAQLYIPTVEVPRYQRNANVGITSSISKIWPASRLLNGKQVCSWIELPLRTRIRQRLLENE